MRQKWFLAVALFLISSLAWGQELPRAMPEKPANSPNSLPSNSLPSITSPLEKPAVPDSVSPSKVNQPEITITESSTTAFQRPVNIDSEFLPEVPAIRSNRPTNQPRETFLQSGANVPIPSGSKKQIIRFAPRYDKINASIKMLPNDSQQLTFVGGLIVNVTYEKAGVNGGPPTTEDIEFAADNGVVWVKGAGGGNILNGGVTTETNPNQPGQAGEKNVQSELFLMGNVVIRTKLDAKLGTNLQNLVNTLRADQVFYQVNENRCIALDATLELNTDGVPDSVYLGGREIQRLNANEWRALEAEAFSSRLPSDPALILTSPSMTYRRRETVRENIFGQPFRNAKTGETEITTEQILTGEDVVGRVGNIPFFYLPSLETDATDPLGPFSGIGFGNDRIFGAQIFTTWDIYKLLAIRPPNGHRWRGHLDYLGDRGPGFGSDYNYTNTRDGIFGGVYPAPKDDEYAMGDWATNGPNRGESRLYVMSDGGIDRLGGLRDSKRNPGVRGRGYWFHDQDFLNDIAGYRWFRGQGQFAYLSDRDFREQFYKNEFDTGRNLESYLYANGATGNLGGSLLLQANTFRRWVTETQSLPRLDGYLLGETLLDVFSYNARGSAGYYRFQPAKQTPLPVVPTDQTRLNTGRFNFNQELSAPIDIGPIRVNPYGVLDLAYYTKDRTGDGQGRVYGGGGARASLPYSKLYEDVESELFNLKGLYHKGSYNINYLYARSNTDYTLLPQIDRLNDDAIDQSYRYIRPVQSLYVPGQAGVDLTSSNLFDPQRLAIRRLLQNKSDTLDDIHAVRVEQHQRLQTKRGFPGSEHTVDWFMLDTAITYFPQKNRDNFGKNWGLLEYSALWNVGDRTALSSSGWFDPFDTGARHFTFGTNLSRPDGTLFFLGYRHIDPIRSRAVTAAIGYQLSRRYSTFLSTTYDFGVQSALSNTVTLNRIGTDVTISVGFTYNAIVNNFGVTITVIPNIVGLFNSQLNGRLIGTQNLGLR